MSAANSDSFTSSFPIWISFPSFPFPIIVAKTSNTTLNKSSENGLHLIPDLKRDILNVHH